MVSKSKLYAQLDRNDEELKRRIIPHLEKAAGGNNDLVFCTTEFSPFPQLKYPADSETDSLIQLGRSILTLRQKLGEETKGTIAERICWYCREWGGTTKHHGKAAQELSVQFLGEIHDDTIC